MNAWKRDDQIVLTATVDKDGILGQIAKISALEEQLRNEVWKLNRMISVEEKAPSDTERSQNITADSDNQ